MHLLGFGCWPLMQRLNSTSFLESYSFRGKEVGAHTHDEGATARHLASTHVDVSAAEPQDNIFYIAPYRNS